MKKKVKKCIEGDGYRCDRCMYEWIPRGKAAPKVCPKCKSAEWNSGIKK